jgi:hypothetical protein
MFFNKISIENKRFTRIGKGKESLVIRNGRCTELTEVRRTELAERGKGKRPLQ